MMLMLPIRHSFIVEWYDYYYENLLAKRYYYYSGCYLGISLLSVIMEKMVILSLTTPRYHEYNVLHESFIIENNEIYCYYPRTSAYGSWTNSPLKNIFFGNACYNKNK